jgi:quercetin dioxygenase-like cupin family protein
MKIVTVKEIPGRLFPKHYDLLGRPVFDANGMKVNLTRMEKTGRCGSHIHEKASQLFIVLKGEMMFQSGEGETLVKAGHEIRSHAGRLGSPQAVGGGGGETVEMKWGQ